MRALILRLFLISTLLTSLSACQKPLKEESVSLPSVSPSLSPSSAPLSSAEPAVSSDSEEEAPIVPYHMEERSFDYDGKHIYCEVFLPDNGMDSHPAVILSHGMGNNHASVNHFAMTFAERGYMSVTFDFCGGCEDCKSSGTLQQMSVLTEAEDLNAVMDHVQSMEECDPEKLFLLGQSQGGVVSAIIGAKRKEETAGMILMYPAFNVKDLSEAIVSEMEDTEETGTIYDQTVSRQYFQDALSLDLDAIMEDYDKDVLILHGSEDTTVEVSYSEAAVKKYPHARLVKVPKAGHGFELEDAPLVDSECLSFLIGHTPLTLPVQKETG